ncbi:MAG TPA: methyltransferase domain-containing protein [Bryobacteraceae bacterium]|nr:methyltransferase domain-containing protein [Bryobacteraceae bacterium]
MDDLAGVLHDLYARQLATLPDDSYLRQHSESSFVEGAVRVFRFYECYLPKEGSILDWGCRHAPDACLIRARLQDRVTLEGCDILDGSQYPVFFECAGLRYAPLHDIVKLPYPDSSFDAVLASGVLEHVPMDHESLKELYRVLRVGGRLIVTYLPNRASIEEWQLRRRGGNHFHWRLYKRSELQNLLLHAGFRPLIAGYQTQLDLLPASGGLAALRPLLRVFQLHRLASCLCAVAEKVSFL